MRGANIIPFLAAIVILAGCVSQSKYLELEKDYINRGIKLAKANRKYEELEKDHKLRGAQVQTLEVLLQKREEELSTTRSVVENIQVSAVGFKEQLERELAALRNEGISINPENNAIVLEDSVFFAKGSATLKEGAKASLMKLARVLKSKSGHIQINGHTDSDPVVKHKKTWPYGNIQLSGARAMHVLLFLKDHGGLDVKRMSFAGYGPYQPIAQNTSESNKRKNRRVEILLQSPGVS
jgi:chemotaxis protein MotB